MVHGVAPISRLVASCAVIPSAGVVMTLLNDTVLLQKPEELAGPDLREINTDFFYIMGSL
jgi:hypothetical protein